MSQRLSEMIRGKFTCNEFSSMKTVRTRARVRSDASKKAWRTRKRMSRSRTMTEPASAQDSHLS